MTCQLLAVCFDANEPLRLARFWAGVLGWEMADGTTASRCEQKIRAEPVEAAGPTAVDAGCGRRA